MASSSKSQEYAPLPHRESVRELLANTDDTDFVISCGDRKFPVHRCVISAQGGFFKSVCERGTFKEGRSNTLSLDKEYPEVIDAVLKYLYGFNYCMTTRRPETERATFHACVYTAGDFYQLPDLKKLARSNFKAVAEHGLAGAKACFAAAKVVYTQTPETDRGLRQIVAETTAESFEALIWKNEDNKQALKDIPGLSYDLALKKGSKTAHVHVGNIYNTAGSNTQPKTWWDWLFATNDPKSGHYPDHLDRM